VHEHSVDEVGMQTFHFEVLPSQGPLSSLDGGDSTIIFRELRPSDLPVVRPRPHTSNLFILRMMHRQATFG
jgi:hypothetical protein